MRRSQRPRPAPEWMEPTLLANPQPAVQYLFRPPARACTADRFANRHTRSASRSRSSHPDSPAGHNPGRALCIRSHACSRRRGWPQLMPRLAGKAWPSNPVLQPTCAPRTLGGAALLAVWRAAGVRRLSHSPPQVAVALPCAQHTPAPPGSRLRPSRHVCTCRFWAHLGAPPPAPLCQLAPWWLFAAGPPPTGPPRKAHAARAGRLVPAASWMARGLHCRLV